MQPVHHAAKMIVEPDSTPSLRVRRHFINFGYPSSQASSHEEGLRCRVSDFPAGLQGGVRLSRKTAA